MKKLSSTLSITILLLLTGCQSDKFDPLIDHTISDSNEKSKNLLAFIGEKIDVIFIPAEQFSMDNKLKARYKIEQIVYGDYHRDTIEFIVYDHYGMPVFSDFKNVLLYVYQSEESYYHVKYQFNNVYKTKDGRWAGTLPIADYQDDENINTNIKPEKIQFAEEVSFPLQDALDDGDIIRYNYPAPYFRETTNKAIAVYGLYAEELFALKKNGVLTLSGFFGDEEEKPLTVKDKALEGDYDYADKTDEKFKLFWNQLTSNLQQNNVQILQTLLLDSVQVIDTTISSGSFKNKQLSLVFDDAAKKSNKIAFSRHQLDPSDIPVFARKSIKKVDGIYQIHTVQIENRFPYFFGWYNYLSFIDTGEGYRFLGYGSSCKWLYYQSL